MFLSPVGLEPDTLPQLCRRFRHRSGSPCRRRRAPTLRSSALLARPCSRSARPPHRATCSLPSKQVLVNHTRHRNAARRRMKSPTAQRTAQPRPAQGPHRRPRKAARAVHLYDVQHRLSRQSTAVQVPAPPQRFRPPPSLPRACLRGTRRPMLKAMRRAMRSSTRTRRRCHARRRVVDACSPT